MHVRPTRLVGLYGGANCRNLYPNGDEICYVLTVFECTVLGGVLKPDDEEIDRAEFLAPGRVLNLDVPPYLPFVLRDLEEDGAAATFDTPTWAPDGSSAS